MKIVYLIIGVSLFMLNPGVAHSNECIYTVRRLVGIWEKKLSAEAITTVFEKSDWRNSRILIADPQKKEKSKSIQIIDGNTVSLIESDGSVSFKAKLNDHCVLDSIELGKQTFSGNECAAINDNFRISYDDHDRDHSSGKMKEIQKHYPKLSAEMIHKLYVNCGVGLVGRLSPMYGGNTQTREAYKAGKAKAEKDEIERYKVEYGRDAR